MSNCATASVKNTNYVIYYNPDQHFNKATRKDFFAALFNGIGAGEYVEVREIGQQCKQHFFTLDQLATYNPPLDKNVYFGVYARTRKSGKSDACSTTGALYADYDDLGDLGINEKIDEVTERIKRAGLPYPSILVNSGHGIHAYWLLKERAGMEAVGMLKAIAKATNSDIKTADKARVMRLPCTLNVKTGNALRCEVVQADYAKIYDLSLFITRLDKYIDHEERKASKVKYGALEGIKIDRYCIAKMLEGVPEGERNFALGRITKYLQVKGYTKQASQEIVLQWNRLNTPPEDEQKLTNDFNSYWRGDYKLLGCVQDNPELQQVLSKHCNRPECPFTAAIGHIVLNNHVQYNNRLLNQISELSGNDLIIYGLLLRHSEGLTTSLLEEKLTSRATGKRCMSRPTMLSCLEELDKRGFIEILRGNKRAGKESLFKAKPQGTYGTGYTLISNGAINGAIDRRITPAEFKLYTLLLKYAFGKGICWPSSRTLAKEVGTTRENVTMLLKGLEEADFIKKDYTFFNGSERLFIKLLV